MKCVLLGIGDYIRDCWHDWLARRLQDVQGERVYTYDADEDLIIWVYSWKEGSMWNYIKQRKNGKQRSKK